MTYLLDTDTFTHAHRGLLQVRARMAGVAAPDRVAVSDATRVEVLTGRFDAVLKAADGPGVVRALERLRASEAYLGTFPLVLFDDRAAAEFDRLAGNKVVRKIGRRDLLHAAVALAHQATLVSRNLKDFKLIPGLIVENWAD